MLAARPTNFGGVGFRCQQGCTSHLVDSTTPPFAGALSQVTPLDSADNAMR
jgi:CRISPR/Cas system CMR-associated protein Cmr1 (group 7 of RAMP superfamily)